jgi:hypothetical protein
MQAGRMPERIKAFQPLMLGGEQHGDLIKCEKLRE